MHLPPVPPNFILLSPVLNMNQKTHSASSLSFTPSHNSHTHSHTFAHIRTESRLLSLSLSRSLCACARRQYRHTDGRRDAVHRQGPRERSGLRQEHDPMIPISPRETRQTQSMKDQKRETERSAAGMVNGTMGAHTHNVAQPSRHPNRHPSRNHPPGSEARRRRMQENRKDNEHNGFAARHDGCTTRPTASRIRTRGDLSSRLSNRRRLRSSANKPQAAHSTSSTSSRSRKPEQEPIIAAAKNKSQTNVARADTMHHAGAVTCTPRHTDALIFRFSRPAERRCFVAANVDTPKQNEWRKKGNKRKGA